ncbi:MAG: hypothetical protein CMN85_11005 [Spongiibacteraceae bacterium]|uniref:hypothetical protein n=1 Tax=uncultured Haliea sp. TaxID=622616 RepID=UPI000C62071C|nr:hypothetical protein [Spongiibacteraceae bacterium]|tara:strand:- start:5154 stop:5369 length:216 start_codon:yes stop_codon:yes gene_type:complete
MNWTKLRPNHADQLPTTTSSARRRALIEKDVEAYLRTGGHIKQIDSEFSRGFVPLSDTTLNRTQQRQRSLS